MRYDFVLDNTLGKCACDELYSINHCLTCKNGGLVNIRHNTMQDTTYALLKEVCKDVQTEPALLPVTGEDLPPGANICNGARADVSTLGFWLPLNRAFFDVKIMNPFAQTNAAKKIPDMYKYHENAKKQEYNDRILQIEKGTFTPLIFSCSAGMAPEAVWNWHSSLAVSAAIHTAR